MGNFVRSRPQPPSGGGHGPGSQAPPGGGDRPALWEYLTCTAYEDGGERQPASLTFFYGAQGFQACLSDKDVGRVAFVSGDSVEAILDALEDQLSTGTADWRKARDPAPRSPRKRP